MSTIDVGQIYQDCSYHPVLCTEVDGDDVAGISLVDGSTPRSCSISHCGVEVMSPEAVRKIIVHREEFLKAEEAFRHTWDTETFVSALIAHGVLEPR